MDDTDTVTDAKLAELLGVAEPTILDLCRRGIILGAHPLELGDSVRMYCAHLRKLAAREVATAAELAELFGVSDRTIRDLTKRGIIVHIGTGIEFARADSVRSYCGHLRELATGRGGEVAIASATSERGRLAKAQADFTETKVRALRGELVEASAVEAEWSGVLRTVRAGLLAVPSRCAARLPHLSAHEVAEIDIEVRAALTEIGENQEDSGNGKR